MGKIINLARSVVQITGPDAQKLLHDTLTCNLSKPLEDEARWFALLTPQGKILFEGLISADGQNGFFLDIRSADKDDFIKRMRLYKMRANLEIVPHDELGVGWSMEEQSDAKQDFRPGMGFRQYAADAVGWDADLDAYHAARVKACIMELGVDFEGSDLFPHDIGMDQLQGVDFQKGCYVGQEVVSRMQHRGTARKRPVCVIGNAAVDDEIICNGKSVGSVTSAKGEQAVALVRLDKVSDPNACFIGDAPIQLAVPEWASYAF